MPDYIDDLHELSVDARGELDNWLALRHLERRGSLPLPIDDADLRSRMLMLVEAGDVVVRAERHRVLWTRSAYGISEAGQRDRDGRIGIGVARNRPRGPATRANDPATPPIR